MGTGLLCEIFYWVQGCCVRYSIGYRVVVLDILLGTGLLCEILYWVQGCCVRYSIGYRVVVSDIVGVNEQH